MRNVPGVCVALVAVAACACYAPVRTAKASSRSEELSRIETGSVSIADKWTLTSRHEGIVVNRRSSARCGVKVTEAVTDEYDLTREPIAPFWLWALAPLTPAAIVASQCAQVDSNGVPKCTTQEAGIAIGATVGGFLLLGALDSLAAIDTSNAKTVHVDRELEVSCQLADDTPPQRVQLGGWADDIEPNGFAIAPWGRVVADPPSPAGSQPADGLAGLLDANGATLAVEDPEDLLNQARDRRLGELAKRRVEASNRAASKACETLSVTAPLVAPATDRVFVAHADTVYFRDVASPRPLDVAPLPKGARVRLRCHTATWGVVQFTDAAEATDESRLLRMSDVEPAPRLLERLRGDFDRAVREKAVGRAEGILSFTRSLAGPEYGVEDLASRALSEMTDGLASLMRSVQEEAEEARRRAQEEAEEARKRAQRAYDSWLKKNCGGSLHTGADVARRNPFNLVGQCYRFDAAVINYASALTGFFLDRNGGYLLITGSDLDRRLVNGRLIGIATILGPESVRLNNGNSVQALNLLLMAGPSPPSE